jgi:PD-(D/E)XK nuclease superfamily
VSDAPSQDVLEAAHCWEAEDRVPGRPTMTAFRRGLRYHHAQWREANGHPIGSQPIVPRAGKPSRPFGSRLPLDYARETGATFLTVGALEAARGRTSLIEPHQSFDHQRLWAELLWSATLAFNLFGDLAADLELADRAVHTWWPDVPGTVSEIRFAHSPGRFDPEYLGSLRAFDAALILDLDDGTHGIIAVDIEYHERARTAIRKPIGLPRHLEVAERSDVLPPETVEAVDRTDLLVMSLEHLLLLSMLQHVSGSWTWGRYVVIHPEANTDYVDACARYRTLLMNDATFASATVEELLDAGVLPAASEAALRNRYLPPPLAR